LREKSRLRVFENRALRKIFGPKRDEVTGEWKKKYIIRSFWSVLLTKYHSGDQMVKNEVEWPCSTYGGGCIEDFGEKTLRKREIL
jgi:hypothetical protein